MAAHTQPVMVAPDAKTQEKYATERAKRLRADGTAQFLNLDESDRFKYLIDDPWVDHDELNAQPQVLTDGGEIKFLIYGGGYGGLVFAARLIDAGFSADNICIVDTAGGFGGTWYWNRYPGLMCDVESYIYMPLLEETGYVPKHKYSYGPELRAQANRIAAQWRIKAQFRSQVKSQTWDEGRKQWKVEITEYRGSKEAGRDITVYAPFVMVTGGLLSIPHIPKLPGLEGFEGQHFHTARWNYGISGGTPDDKQLTGLQGKRVGIIGTGATAIQVVPELAKWAGELYVFQRTPSACDTRGQHETDPEVFKTKIATGKGWQRARSENFASHLCGAPQPVDLVNDGWSNFAAYKALLGQQGKILRPEDIPAHIAELHSLDFPRSERVRARAEKIVQEKATAEKLKAWYAGWCKRPTFHDEYLQSFNKPTVHLVDTDGKGVDRLTKNAVVANGVEYPVDVLVFATGFRSPSTNPAFSTGARVTGRNGADLNAKWDDGAATLHGISTHDFPNLFFFTPTQTGMTANVVHILDVVAEHIGYILNEAAKKAGSDKFVVEVTKEAEEAWAMQTAMRAAMMAAIIGCTPSYITREGEAEKVVQGADGLKMARSAPWGEGIIDYTRRIEAWRAAGGLEGIEVTA
ncbi:flavin-binding monooxygenase-like family protein [Auricularia subglabra TFB-10046 SS5]|uniref:Flavin-binding monooxygenase-like family protein n=2 Tax=Auricularia subglabra (strain TFB-10046 / SS5) TaxID=717982 RepID=J0WUP6_AURST|nr:flavin-binding monooxygenase-like family protein [Auricularia subglabra TFB-10046 SS5]